MSSRTSPLEYNEPLAGSTDHGPYLHQVRKIVDQGTTLLRKAFDVTGPIVDPDAHDFSLPLVHTLIQARQGRADGGLFLFTSVSRGEGVSYVVESVARELARITPERILLATQRSLSGLAPTHFRELLGNAFSRGREAEDHLVETKAWRLSEILGDQELLPLKPHTHSLELLRRWFGYVLVECPPLREFTPSSQVARASDGTLLVVAAGQTKSDQILQAQKLLEISSCNLLGVVLNKRTQPIPKFINKFL
jgi:hypothetical protein